MLSINRNYISNRSRMELIWVGTIREEIINCFYRELINRL